MRIVAIEGPADQLRGQSRTAPVCSWAFAAKISALVVGRAARALDTGSTFLQVCAGTGAVLLTCSSIQSPRQARELRKMGRKGKHGKESEEPNRRRTSPWSLCPDACGVAAPAASAERSTRGNYNPYTGRYGTRIPRY